MSRQRQPSLEAAAVLALYALLGSGLMAGPLLSGGERVVGHPESDVWKHLWGAWWVVETLASGALPYSTDLQNFPEGGRLFVIDPLNTVLSAPWQGLVGLPQAYNMVMAFQVTVAAFCAWLLARELTDDGRAALVAGTAYGFSPFLLTSGLSSGIAETANLAWLPLALLGLLRCLAHRPAPSPRRWIPAGAGAVAIGGAGLFLSAFGSWYYGMAAGLTTLLLAAWTAWRGVPVPQPPERPHWGRFAMALVLAALLALPFAVAFLRSLAGEGSLLARVDVTARLQESSLEFLHRQGNFKNDADLAGYFLPGKQRLSVAEDLDRRLKTVYAGLLVWSLALMGLVRGERWTRFWGLLAGVMLVLSLGPYLYVAPGVGLPGAWNPLYMLAYHGLPGFRFIAIADRLSIAVQLALAILAAVGVAGALRGISGRQGWLAAGAVSLAILAEVAWVSPVPWPLPTAPAAVPEVARVLATEPGRFGVVDLPLNRVQETLQPGEYFYWQTVHGKPLPLALTTRFPQAMMENRLVGTLYLCEVEFYDEPPPAKVLRPGLEELRRMGFGAIVVHVPLMTPAAARRVEGVLTGLVGDPRRFADGRLLYRL